MPSKSRTFGSLYAETLARGIFPFMAGWMLPVALHPSNKGPLYFALRVVAGPVIYAVLIALALAAILWWDRRNAR